MMKAILAVALAVCVVSCAALPYDQFANPYIRASKTFAHQSWPTEIFYYLPGLPGGFKCPALAASPSIPTDARFVRPGDVKVVGALGDSITVGYGVLANTVTQVLRHNRGLSWSVGGDRDINTVLTLPNILKKYNSRIYGYSIGSGYVEDVPEAYYNVASGGDTAANMVEQSLKLIEKVLADGRQNEWKLITLFIGGNDVCRYCRFQEILSPENFKRNIETALDNIYNEFRNTIVNLVGPIDMTEVLKLAEMEECNNIHNTICGCLFEEPDYASRVSQEYQSKVLEIIRESSTRYTRSDFAVSYHPQFVEADLPMANGRPDLSYFAPDCFHFSQKGQEHAAITLWNNMLKPVNQRATNLQFEDRTMNCPTEEEPFIKI